MLRKPACASVSDSAGAPDPAEAGFCRFILSLLNSLRLRGMVVKVSDFFFALFHMNTMEIEVIMKNHKLLIKHCPLFLCRKQVNGSYLNALSTANQ